MRKNQIAFKISTLHIPVTLNSRIKIGLRLLIFGNFPGATSLIKKAIHKKSEILLFYVVGYVFQGAMFIVFAKCSRG